MKEMAKEIRIFAKETKNNVLRNILNRLYSLNILTLFQILTGIHTFLI